MGHKGDIEARYSTNKNLSDEIKDQIRETYKKCQKYLSTQTIKTQEENLTEKLREYTLTIFETTFNTKLKKEKKEELMKLSTENFEEELRRISTKRKKEILNNGNTQKIITINEIEKYINQGWEFITTLPNGKAIIRIPKTET